MTDASGAKDNSIGRRSRRTTRLTTGREGARPEASKEKEQNSANKAAERQGASAEKSPLVGRRSRSASGKSRRRRQAGRQLSQADGQSDLSSNTSGKTSGSSRSRLRSRNGHSKNGSAGKLIDRPQKSTSRREAGSLDKKRALKVVSPGRNSEMGKRSPSSRTSSPRTASAGSVPLSSSLVRRRSRRPKLPKYAISAIWILVGGLGLATIFGTILANRPGGEPSAALTESVLSDVASADSFPIALGQEIPQLKAKLEELPTLYPNLNFKAFYVDVDTGDYVNVDGREAIAAASTIKLPILIAFFEEVDKGNIDPNQTIAMLKEQVAEGSGEMQMSPPGTQFTALEVATQMIVNSDNTATNMMVALLGGNEVLNQRFAGYGLEETRLANPLPDIEGTNTTSARDLVHSMLLVQGDTLSVRSRDRVFNILQRTENKRLLAAGLEEKGALTYNKTGFIGKMLGDVAIVDLNNGKRYAVSVLVERPNNDGRALELIHSVSGRTFQYADQSVRPAVTPLGNPDGETAGRDSSDSPEGDASTEASGTASDSEPNGTSSITITQPQSEQPAASENDAVESSEPTVSEPTVDEEPYPSANP